MIDDKSPIYCNHANEVVSGCICLQDCYCRAYGTCPRIRGELYTREFLIKKVKKLESEVAKINKQRIIEQGAWEQVDAYKQENANFKKSFYKWGNVLEDVVSELNAQVKKWGIQNHHPKMWMNILMEEVGESSKAMMEHHYRHANSDDYRMELIQVAAVAIAAIENYDRSRNA